MGPRGAKRAGHRSVRRTGRGQDATGQGAGARLGITARVHSPTFALVNVYPGGRLPLFHLDLYRLETPEQILAAGLEEYLRAGTAWR